MSQTINLLLNYDSIITAAAVKKNGSCLVLNL